VNLNAQLSYVRSNWTIDLYGQNLTDELVRTWQDAISVFSGTAPLTDNGTIVTTRFAPPRTYGYSF
jgi:outer membrane receptor protein involved in Fe transport